MNQVFACDRVQNILANKQEVNFFRIYQIGIRQCIHAVHTRVNTNIQLKTKTALLHLLTYVNPQMGILQKRLQYN